MSTTTDPRYPIGSYQPKDFSDLQKKEWINDIRQLPGLLENTLVNLDAHQLDTPYRDGGWKVKQLVHHIADSHINAYMRLKLGLTEENPTIKPYDEKLWSELPDVTDVPVNISVTLIHALHRRWVSTLRHLKTEEWGRTYFHPERKQSVPLWEMTAMYAWHSEHHFEHICRLRERMGWL